MKKIISLVMGVGMLALVAGCSDDSSSVSCTTSANGVVQYCITSSDMTEANCTDGMGTVVDTCPDASVSDCKVSQGGKSGTVYFYSQDVATMLSSMCGQ
jgi:hypothetical protein